MPLRLRLAGTGGHQNVMEDGWPAIGKKARCLRV